MSQPNPAAVALLSLDRLGRDIAALDSNEARSTETLAAAAARAKAVETERQAAEGDLQKLKRREKEIELEIASLDEEMGRLKGVRERSSTSAAFAAAGKELETRHAKMDQLENEGLEILAQCEKLEAAIAQLNEKWLDMRGRHGEAHSSHEALLAANTAKRETLSREREAALAAMSGALREKYNEVFRTTGAPSTAVASSGFCNVCEGQLPPQALAAARMFGAHQSDEGMPPQCPSCNRILVGVK